MQILQATEVTAELVAAFGRLVPQLNPTATPPTREHLERLVRSPGVALLVAHDAAAAAPVLGALTLAWYPIPTGVRAWIEDVVVDPAARGRGIGEALVRAALERARREGAGGVDLTSRPEREAANRLYQRVGFQLRQTNAYRYRFDDLDGR